MTNPNYEKEILKEMEQQYRNSLPPTFKDRAINFLNTHKWHAVVLIILIILTTFASMHMHDLGDKAGIASVAKKQLQEEISKKEKEFKDVDAVKTQLNTTIYNLTQASAENGEINVRIKENEEKMSSLETEITEAQELSDSLDQLLEIKRQTSSQVTSITSASAGTPKVLEAGDYLCPSEIKAGTYTISGESGNIILYDIANSIRLSQNLDDIAEKEFTLRISEGEKLKINKDMKIASIN